MHALTEVLATGAPASVDDATRVLTRLARQYGFDNFAYIGGRAFNATQGGHDMWAQPPTIIIDYPAEWVQVYHDEDFGKVDPALATMFQRRLPFVWDAGKLAKEVEAPPQKRFLDSARDFRMSRGLTVPVYGPAGDFAMFSFVSSGSQQEFSRIVDAYGHDLHLLSLYFHQAIATAIAAREPEESKLTSREREVLHWAASGKTFEEIGIILGISRRTVEAHIYNAMKKLDVYNTPQAVAKAILLGLIQP